jgi:hypothetical protein
MFFSEVNYFLRYDIDHNLILSAEKVRSFFSLFLIPDGILVSTMLQFLRGGLADDYKPASFLS